MTAPLVLGHLDQSERPCERHPIDLAALLHLAAIGARAASFNHDIASKIQGVMMAIDEIAELANTPDLVRATETAHQVLTELNQLLQQSRALTKAPVASRVSVHDVLSRAAQRVGVTLEGDRAIGEVEIAVPLVTHGLALLIDGAAGQERRRVLGLGVRSADGVIELSFPIAADATLSGETLAIVAWIATHDRGELRCSEAAVELRLPLAE